MNRSINLSKMVPIRAVLMMLVAIFATTWANAQTTITLGTSNGTQSGTGFGPVYLNAANISFLYSRTSSKYSISELQASGIACGSTITSMAFNKTTTTATASGRNGIMRIYLRNSTTPNASTTWSTTNATLVYQNTTQTFSSATGWIPFAFSSSFAYSGPYLEVLVEFTANGSVTGFTTGAIGWQYSAASYYSSGNALTLGVSNAALPTALSNAATYIPSAQFTYNAPSPVSIDVTASALVSPGTSGVCYGPNSTVTARIRNNGTSTINLASTPITISGSASGAATQIFNPVTISTGTLAAGATTDVTLSTTLNASVAGTVNFGIRATVTGDLLTCNDSVSFVRTVDYSVASGSINTDFTGFTGANLPAITSNQWKEATSSDLNTPNPTGTASNWTSQTGLGGASNVTSRILMGTQVPNPVAGITLQRAWMISPKYTPVASDVLSFTAAITDNGSLVINDTMDIDDEMSVMISTNCGTSWTRALTINRETYLGVNLRRFTVPLGQYAGQQILIGFYASDGSKGVKNGMASNAVGYDLHIDSITVGSNPSADVAISSIAFNSIATGCNLTNAEAITVSITNVSSSPVTLTAAPLRYRINGGSWISVGSYTGTIAAGATATQSISVNLSATGVNQLEVGIVAPTDADRSNDINNTSITNLGSNALTATYSESFEGINRELPAGWRTVDNLRDAVLLTSGSYANMWENVISGAGQFNCNGTNAICYFPLNTNPFNDYIFSRCFYFDAASTYSLQFGFKVSSPTAWITPPAVRFGVANSQVPGAFVMNIDSVRANSGSGSCNTIQRYFRVSTSGYYYIGWQLYDGNSGGVGYPISLDDIQLNRLNNTDLTYISAVTPITGCSLGTAEPVVIKIKNSGVDTVRGGFTINYTFSGARTGSGTYTASPSDIINPFDTATITLGTVNVSTAGQYNFNFNITYTGDQNTSDNIGTTSFHNTAPQDFTASAFIEDFESAAGTPVGWKMLDANGDVIVNVRNVWGNQTFASCQGGRAAYFSPTTGIATPNDFMYTRCLNLVNGTDYALSYTSAVSAAWTTMPRVRIGFSAAQDGNANFDSLYTLHVTNTTCTRRTDSFTWNKPSGTYYLTFHIYSGNDNASETLNIDSIVVRRLSPCPDPTSISVTPAVNTGSASWSSNVRHQSYDLYFGTNPLASPSAGTTATRTTTVPSSGLGSLVPATSYSLYVRARCGNTYGNSSWVGPVSFNTKPANDECSSATFVPVSLTTSCSGQITSTNAGATASANTPGFSCGIAASVNKDIWFKTVVPGSGRFTVQTSQFANSLLTDPVLQVYRGTCGALTQVGCNDNNGNSGHSRLDVTGQNPGDTLLIRISDYNGALTGSFYLCIYDSLARNLGVSNFYSNATTVGNYTTPRTLNAVVTNYGPVVFNGSLNVAYAENGTQKTSQAFNISNLAVGASQTVTFTQTWSTTATGAIRLCAYTQYAAEISRLNDTACLLLNSSANTPTHAWVKTGGGSTGDEAGMVNAVDGNGNVFVAGTYNQMAIFGVDTLRSNNASFERDLYVAKIDSNGNILWARTAGGAYGEDATGMVTDAAGNVYVTGSFVSSATFGTITINSAGSRDGFLVKYNPNGVVQYATAFGGVGGDYPKSMAINSTGTQLAICGFFLGSTTYGSNSFSTSNGNGDVILLGVDPSNGSISWAATSPGVNHDAANGVAYDNSGNILMTGILCNNSTGVGPWNLRSSGTFNAFVVKYTNTGTFVWANVLQGRGNEYGVSVTSSASNDVFVTGYFDDNIGPNANSLTATNGSFDWFVAKWNSAGTYQYIRTSGGTGQDVANSITSNAAGDNFVTGFFQNDANFFGTIVTSTGLGDAFASAMDASGNSRWVNRSSGTGTESGNDIEVSSTGSVYYTGSINGTTSFGSNSANTRGAADMFMAKLAPASSMQAGPVMRGIIVGRELPVVDLPLVQVPVDWITFNSKKTVNGLQLQWSTVREFEGTRYIIEQSTDGINWNEISSVQANATFDPAKAYTATISAALLDENAVIRVRQQTNSGIYAVSDQVSWKADKKATFNVSVYPNPAQATLNIATNRTLDGQTNIVVMTADGRIVRNIESNNLNRITSLNVSDMAEGIYFIRITNGAETVTSRVVVKR